MSSGAIAVTDLALLKVDAKTPLPAAAWGDSNKARVGDWVLAIGNPFGLGGTVTAGIISATARDIHSSPYDDYLQTDASINRGNSGGPMFNLAGEVIGINTVIYSPSGGSIGIGFAIPSALARPIIEQLKATGKVERGWIGARIQPVTDDIAESVGLDKSRGAMIAAIDPGSPAAQAKLQPGDVILSYDGTADRAQPPAAAAGRRDPAGQAGESDDLARRQGARGRAEGGGAQPQPAAARAARAGKAEAAGYRRCAGPQARQADPGIAQAVLAAGDAQRVSSSPTCRRTAPRPPRVCARAIW